MVSFCGLCELLATHEHICLSFVKNFQLLIFLNNIKIFLLEFSSSTLRNVITLRNLISSSLHSLTCKLGVG